MPALALVLKLCAPIFLLVGLLHLVLGVGADVLLGAQLPPEAILEPTLDSQNRFYGVSFTLYGILLFVCAGDLRKYATVLRCLLWVFFAAGVARLVSVALLGWPSAPVLFLLAIELCFPPLLAGWLSRVLKAD